MNKKKKGWMPRRVWTIDPCVRIKVSGKIYGKKDRKLNKVNSY
jgi:hypothetical protein